MNEGVAKKLETEKVIFPMEFAENNQETRVFEETTVKVASEKLSVKTGIEHRFARLKKSLRKRSASIL